MVDTQRSDGRRQGEIFVTESLDFASYLEEVAGLKLLPGFPRPTTNKFGRTRNRHEWHFEDPTRSAEAHWDEFRNGPAYRLLRKRADNVSCIKNRRVERSNV